MNTERKLATILATDCVNFSKHMEENEELTLSNLNDCRKIIDERFLVVLCPDLKAVVHVANRVAPEHLELQVAEADLTALKKEITTAGAMLLGYMTPTVVGDFVAGPSHTLPTGQAGRFFSGLQASDFMRRTSLLQYDAYSLKNAASTVKVFAALEQLDAHGRSLTLRL